MKFKNKLLFGTASILAVAAPLAAVVSCGTTDATNTTKTEGTVKATSATSAAGSTSSTNATNTASSANTTSAAKVTNATSATSATNAPQTKIQPKKSIVKKHNVVPKKVVSQDAIRQISYLKDHKLKLTDTLEVKDDVVLLAHAYYGGTINDKYDNDANDGVAVINEKTNSFDMYDTSGPTGKAHAIMISQNDSFLYAFDKDDKDGLTIDNFIKTHYFMDTSVNWNRETKKLNEKLGAFRESYNTMVPFRGTKTKGNISAYLGSQNNHTNLTWAQAMAKIKKTSPDYFKILNEYYKTASKAFVPIITNNGQWMSYEKIAKNVMKVTFHKLSSTPITAAAMVTKPDLANSKYRYVGPLSISEQDHAAYHNGKYSILGDRK